MIDDEVGYCRSLCRDLQRVGWSAKFESDPANAFAAAVEFRPAIAFIDLRLDGEDGCSLAASLKHVLPELVVVGITGFLTDEALYSMSRVADYVVEKSAGTETMVAVAAGLPPEPRVFTEATYGPLSDRQNRQRHARNIRASVSTAEEAATKLAIDAKTLRNLLKPPRPDV